MQSQFLSFMDRYKLTGRGEATLLAVSGGIDSVVMADLFVKNDYSVGLVHCNFGLRGKDSEEDENFVKELASNYGVPVYTRAFDAYGEASKEKISIQMAARNLRYRWFKQLLDNEAYKKLATAHHGDDLLETILLNLTRGTGISGLHGILPKQGQWIRPLLFAGKEEIVNYARNHQLQWREDSTNETVKYRRNLIRHQVIPVLKQMNPDLVQTTMLTSERVRAAETFYQEALNNFEYELVTRRGKDYLINIPGLQKTPESTVMLWEFLKQFRFTYKQTREMAAFLNLENKDHQLVGKMFYSSSHVINVDRQELILSPLRVEKTEKEREIYKDDQELAEEDFGLTLETYPVHTYKITANPEIAALDFNKLKFPLYLRPWRKGDRFIPLGMKNKKKLSDFMIDEKIPVNLKNRLYVLLSGDDIVWVVGYRIDDRFKVTNSTSTVYQVILQNYD